MHGYVHKCRRKGCGYERRESHAERGGCPRCDMRLWAKTVPLHRTCARASTGCRSDPQPRRSSHRLWCGMVRRWCGSSAGARTRAGARLKRPTNPGAEDWSGRQDLNLRPPGPEPRPSCFPLVRRLLTTSQALEIRKGSRRPRILNPRPATPCEARFVAPVSPAITRTPGRCQANRFYRWRASPRNWGSAARQLTDCASAASLPTFASRTRSVSRPPPWRPT